MARMARLSDSRGHVEQLLDIGGDLADGQRDGRIAAPAADLAARIDGDDVSGLQRAAIGNAVHDVMVDAGADDGREGRFALDGAGVAQEQRQWRRVRERRRQRRLPCRRSSRLARQAGEPGRVPGRPRGRPRASCAISRGLFSFGAGRAAPGSGPPFRPRPDRKRGKDGRGTMPRWENTSLELLFDPRQFHRQVTRMMYQIGPDRGSLMSPAGHESGGRPVAGLRSRPGGHFRLTRPG